MTVDHPVIPPTCGDCCTRLEHVGVTLGGHPILSEINLHLHCGQLAAIIGPNGGGKTTLLRTILGEIPYSGTIHNELSKIKGSQKLVIGYVPQRLGFDATSPVTVLDLFAASLSARPVWLGFSRPVVELARSKLSVVGAADLLRSRLGALSGGQLQRVLLALALTPAPDLLLLDEPVSGVDPAGIDLFYKMISDLRQIHHLAIVLVSHDIVTAARYADRMLFLNQRVIADGLPAAVLRQPAVIETFGRFDVDRSPGSLEAPACRCRYETAGVGL
jgi:zinc transport system ATP-binding protein